MLQAKKILIIEDDADIQMIEETYLQAAGFQTITIADGRQVDEALKENELDHFAGSDAAE